MSKLADRWHSPRLGRNVEISRWGEVGTPVLVFPTAGGDSQEIERFHMIDACADLIATGRIKVYSCDSINGRAMLTAEGDSYHLSWMLKQFIEFVRHELVPAICADCQTDDIEIITAGSSIGGYNALSVLCRYPEVFSAAVCMSGTFDLARFLDGPASDDFHWASPVHGLDTLPDDHLAKLRERQVVFACGGGANEDIGESWHAAHVLGAAGVPTRVVEWGPEWPHDWHTWREMLPLYLNELV